MNAQQIAAFLRESLNAKVAERTVIDAAAEQVKNRLESRLKRAVKKPVSSMEVLDRRIEELEYRRTTTSMTLQEEKRLLQDINSIKVQKGTIAEYAAFNEEMSNLKAQRSELGDKLKLLSQSIREMREGLRKMEIMERVQAANPGILVSPVDIRVAEMLVGAEHLPVIIGRRGAQLREIEEAAAVVLDVASAKERESRAAGGAGGRGGGGGASSDDDGKETGPASVRITGLEAGIVKAQALIEAITSQVEESCPVSEGVLQLLLASSGAHIRELESSHGVRLHLDRTAKAVGARGPAGGVSSLMARLAEAEARKRLIPVDLRVLPAVIGKGGANLKRLREDCVGIEIDVQRNPDGLTGVIAIYSLGEPAGIDAAAAEIGSLITTNTEVEEAVDVPKDAIPWLVGKAGERIQAFQKEFGVYARIVRDAPAAAGGDAPPPTSTSTSSCAVVIRGRPESVAKARPAFDALLFDFRRTNVTLTLNTAQARAIIGQGGATIKRLRAETGAAIEVDEAAAPPTAAAAAGDEGEGGGADSTEASKASSRARERRAARAADVPVGYALIHVRGDAEAVAAGVAAVRALAASYTETRVAVSSAVLSALLANKGEVINALSAQPAAAGAAAADGAAAPSPAAAGAVEGAVTIDIEREGAGGSGAPAAGATAKERSAFFRRSRGGGGGASSSGGAGGSAGTVTISGPAASVAAAEAKLRALIAAHSESVLPLPDAGIVGELVGKGGVNIRALSAETGAELEVNKEGGVVRIIGTPAAIEVATARLSALFTKYAEENATMHVDPSLLPGLIGKGGAGIRALAAETGAEIHIGHFSPADAAAAPAAGPDRSGATGTQRGEVRLHGPPAAIAAARARITEICRLDKAAEGVTVPLEVVGALIGRGGGGLRALEAAHHVTIQVESGSGLFMVRGEPADVSAARAAIKRAAREADRAEVEVGVPVERMAGLIGPRGSHLHALEADCDATIDTPLPPGKEGSESRQRGGKGGGKPPSAAAVPLAPGLVPVRLRGCTSGLAKAKAAVEAIALGRSLRLLPRPASAVTDLRALDGKHLDRVAAAEGVRIRMLDGEPLLHEDDGGVPSGSAEATEWTFSGPGRGLVLIDGSDEGAVSRAVSAVDKLLAFRRQGSYALVAVPGAFAEGLLTTPAAAAASASAPRKAPLRIVPAAAAAAAAAAAGAGADDTADAAADAPAAASSEDSAGAAPATATETETAAVDAEEASEAAPAPAPAAPLLPLSPGLTLSALKAGAPGVCAQVELGAGGAAAGAYVALWAPSPAALPPALSALSTAVAAFSARHAEVPVEGWCVSELVGKKGAGISALEAATGAKFNIDRGAGGGGGGGGRGGGAGGRGGPPLPPSSAPVLVRIVARDAASLASARTALAALVTAAGKRRITLAVPSSAFGGLIGKGGANIRALQEASGAFIDLDKEGERVHIRGASEAVVEKAREAVEAHLAEAGMTARTLGEAEVAEAAQQQRASASHAVVIRGVDSNACGAIIGKGGANIRAMTEDTGARIDLRKEAEEVHVSGPNAEVVAAGVAAVQAVLDGLRSTSGGSGSSGGKAGSGGGGAAAAAGGGAGRAASGALAAAAALSRPAAAAAGTTIATAPSAAAAAGAAAAPSRLPIGADTPNEAEIAAEAEKRRARNAKKREAKRAKTAAASGSGGGAAPADDDEEVEDEGAPAASAASKSAAAAPSGTAPSTPARRPSLSGLSHLQVPAPPEIHGGAPAAFSAGSASASTPAPTDFASSAAALFSIRTPAAAVMAAAAAGAAAPPPPTPSTLSAGGNSGSNTHALFSSIRPDSTADDILAMLLGPDFKATLAAAGTIAGAPVPPGPAAAAAPVAAAPAPARSTSAAAASAPSVSPPTGNSSAPKALSSFPLVPLVSSSPSSAAAAPAPAPMASAPSRAGGAPALVSSSSAPAPVPAAAGGAAPPGLAPAVGAAAAKSVVSAAVAAGPPPGLARAPAAAAAAPRRPQSSPLSQPPATSSVPSPASSPHAPAPAALSGSSSGSGIAVGGAHSYAPTTAAAAAPRSAALSGPRGSGSGGGSATSGGAGAAAPKAAPWAKPAASGPPATAAAGGASGNGVARAAAAADKAGEVAAGATSPPPTTTGDDGEPSVAAAAAAAASSIGSGIASLISGGGGLLSGLSGLLFPSLAPIAPPAGGGGGSGGAVSGGSAAALSSAAAAARIASQQQQSGSPGGRVSPSTGPSGSSSGGKRKGEGGGSGGNSSIRPVNHGSGGSSGSPARNGNSSGGSGGGASSKKDGPAAGAAREAARSSPAGGAAAGGGRGSSSGKPPVTPSRSS